jgi:hypothetical protein
MIKSTGSYVKSEAKLKVCNRIFAIRTPSQPKETL